MERYRKLKVIGKGSFGYAVLVQSVNDRQTYVMKVPIPPFTSLDYRCVEDGPQAKRRRDQRGSCFESHETSIHHHLQRVIYGQTMPVYRDGLCRRRRPLHEDC